MRSTCPCCSWIAGATEVDVSAARKAILIKASPFQPSLVAGLAVVVLL